MLSRFSTPGVADVSSTEEVNDVGSSCPNRKLKCLDHDHIAQLTKLQSRPHQNLARILPGKRDYFPVSTVKMLAGREANVSGRGRFSSGDCCHILSKYLPVNGPSVVDEASTRAYVSQFSDDGSLFLAAFQGSQIRIYDVERGWKLHKDILARSLRWTFTDMALSPDKRHLVYSSLSPVVHFVDVGSATKESRSNISENIGDCLDLSSPGDGTCFIFSVKFSNDGGEILAGSSNGDIYVYDLEAKRLSLQISAHECDVNTVCFADESGHIIYSGSDDCFCKVWDRRCIDQANGKPAGILVGHTEGVTFIDSRRDGRYLISNGKDQAIKLWDTRKMSSSDQRYQGYKKTVLKFDYRWDKYHPQDKVVFEHPPFDQSIATYKGHSVLRTLIRCYFSPEYSTGRKYIYTGSNDSCIYIYDLVTGAQVAKLQHHRSTVRDCSWHPTYPMLVSSSWDRSVVKWEFSTNNKHSSKEVMNFR